MSNMMSEIKERKRAPNFTLSEELCLVELVEQKAPAIHCKHMDSASLEKKRKAWEEIDQDFLLRCGIQRGTTKLKWKYDSLKRKARKSLADIKPCCTTIEGGTAADGDTDQIEDKMAALMGVSDFEIKVDDDDGGMGVSDFEIKVDDDDGGMGVSDFEIKVDDDDGSPMQDYTSTSTVPEEDAKNDFDVDLSACIKVESFADIESTNHSCHAPDAFLFDGKTSGVVNYKPNVPTTATEAQRAYYVNEDRRANERHSWKWEKHQRKNENWLMKGQLLRYELAAKEKELNTGN